MEVARRAGSARQARTYMFIRSEYVRACRGKPVQVRKDPPSQATSGPEKEEAKGEGDPSQEERATSPRLGSAPRGSRDPAPECSSEESSSPGHARLALEL